MGEKVKIRNRVQVDGKSVVVGAETITVFLQDSDGMIMDCAGTTVPTDDTAGYAKGCRFVDTDVADNTSGVYENIGTTTVCEFNAVSVIDTAEITDLAVTTAKINDEAVTPAKTSGVLILADLGTPALKDDNYFLISVDMQATAYTLDETALAATDVARNVIITHVATDTADTLGDAVITGTNINDEVITETITISSGGVATGAKAFKTITSVVTASWVIDGVEGNEDKIEVGFGDLIGLPKVFASAVDVWLDKLAGAVIYGTVAVNASDVESNTIDMSSGTFDGSKQATVAYIY